MRCPKRSLTGILNIPPPAIRMRSARLSANIFPMRAPPSAALDDCLEGIDPTYIKLHLEGGEYAALIGAEKTVRRAAPRLAVCVDHCAEDIVRIPQKILEYDSAYKLYLRHYSTSITETVLYAVK